MTQNKNIEVAEYMIEELLNKKLLYPNDFVEDIHNKFGEEFISYTDRGYPVISSDVKKEFKKLKNQYDVNWDNQEKCWKIN